MQFADVNGANPVNTFDDWKIVPASRPLVNPPEVRTEFVDVPGADGSLDYTEVLSGIKFKNREGSWEFYVLNELYDRSVSYHPWNELYTLIMRRIHGRRLRIWMESDPDFYYYGRLMVDQWQSNKDYSKIVINYNLDPYKEPNRTSAAFDWQWNDLFSNQIYYGQFNVNGTKWRTFYNFSEYPVDIWYTLSAPMYITIHNVRKYYNAGRVKGDALVSGDNYVIFEGTGSVVADHSLGKRL